MARDTKILLGCVAGVVLFGLCTCCGVSLTSFGVLGAAVGPDMEGERFGQQASQHEACVGAAFTRVDRCTDNDLSCAFEVAVFEGACLATVQADPAAFCEGVAAAAEFGEGASSRAFCAEHGRQANFDCGAVYGAAADFCESYVAGR